MEALKGFKGFSIHDSSVCHKLARWLLQNPASSKTSNPRQT